MIAALTLLSACAAPLSNMVPNDTGVGYASGGIPSAKSAALAEYYASLQFQMRRRGLIRQEGDDTQIPFTARALAENFETIALYDEYKPGQGGFRQSQTPSYLRRWEKPVRMKVEFGASVPNEVRQSDAAFVAGYSQHLGAVTGHPVTMSSRNPNFLVMIVGEDDRRVQSARLRSFVPGISDQTVTDFQNMPRSILCMVYAFPGVGRDEGYSHAVAVIRAEHPTLLRQSCIHEELAQGLGLANDSPRARPSIFNDDEEFGFLTLHDELLLRMLYDPRLKLGMMADEARPIVTQIASELAS